MPFQWDDRIIISNNTIITDLSYFSDPSLAKGFENYGLFIRRYIAFLTFALNYSIHGLDVEGYHLTNMLIHMTNAVLLYFLINNIFETPLLRGGRLKAKSGLIALFASALFVSHPIQTEAVTYVMQRFASLCALFYILSLLAYLKFRNTGSKQYLAVSLVSAFAAMNVKEISLTLPFAVVLAEIIFYRKPGIRNLAYALPFFALLIIFPIKLHYTGIPIVRLLTGSVSTENDALCYTNQVTGEHICRSGYDRDYLHPPYTKTDYLNTQVVVVITYLRLLLFPYGQNIDHDLDLYTSFIHSHVIASLIIIFLMLGLAAFFLHKSRLSEPAWCAVSFGIMMFFLCLSVESSVLPIPVIISEYRVYLPSAGFFTAVSVAMFLLLDAMKGKRGRIAFAIIIATIPLGLTAATYSRNTIWHSPILLWKDVVSKAPENERGHYNLCISYDDEGQNSKALEHCLAAVRLRPDFTDAHINLAIAYENTGLMDKAMHHYKTALTLRPDDARAHNNIALAYAQVKNMEKSLEHLIKSVNIMPHNTDARFNLGLAHVQMGNFNHALKEFQTVLMYDPGHPNAESFIDFCRKSTIK